MTKPKLTAPAGKQEVISTCVFDAPRRVVFAVYTDRNLIPKWWGPRGLKTVIDKMDLKPGGIWRYVQSDSKGEKFAFHGVYHTVDKPDRLVYTFEYEGMPGHVLMETVIFDEEDGKTRITDTSVFQSVEDRDGMFQSGMEEGSNESMERIAELLAKA